MARRKALAPRTLGICLTTRDGARHVLGLACAAARAGICTEVFLTGEGVHMIRSRGFHELVAVARVGVCDASYRTAGLDYGEAVGLSDKDFVTQWRNAEMVYRCDRYLVL